VSDDERHGTGLGHAARAAAAVAVIAIAAACHSPGQSQAYFARAAVADPMLELIHETPLYSVYFDHALRRCVLHSAHTWGENGGGGGGTGIGVALFPCDPAKLKARAEELRRMIESGRTPVLPAAAPVETAPTPAGGTGAAPTKAPTKASAPSESYPGSVH
jgi:hypothetical protein